MPFTEKLHCVLADGTLWTGLPAALPDPKQIVVSAAIPGTADHPIFRLDSGLTRTEFEVIPGQPIVVAYRDLLTLFSEDERGSRSSDQGSAAIYLAWREYNGSSMLLQVLPPHSRTSCHYHRDTEEVFQCLAGTCTVGTCSRTADSRGTKVLHPGMPYTVPANTIHQMWTDDAPAVNFLDMRGLPRATKMDDHVHVLSPFFP